MVEHDLQFYLRLNADEFPYIAHASWLVSGAAYRGRYIDPPDAVRRRVELYRPDDERQTAILHADQLEPEVYPRVTAYQFAEEKRMEDSDRSPELDGGVDARRSPFYEWLDNTAIRELVHRIQELSAGEQLVLIKGLIPGLVSAMGLAEFDAFLSEITIKARRFQEAVDHPGEGRELRVTPGEEIGGPTPSGHLHLPTARDPNHRGAREAERLSERQLWRRNEDDSARPPDPR